MEKNTRKMSKGTVGLKVGLGASIASLMLSGAIILSKNDDIDGLESQNKKLEDIVSENTLIIEKQQSEIVQLNNAFNTVKVKNEDLKLSVKIAEEDNLRLKQEIKNKENEIKNIKEKKVSNVKTTNKLSYSGGEWMTFTQTHYTSFCNTGCTGQTATGINVKNTVKYKGMSIIAVDPRVIPLGSIVEINDGDKVFQAFAGDTGGAIKGSKIDLLVSTNDSNYAYSLGVKKVKLKVLRRGWDKA